VDVPLSVISVLALFLPESCSNAVNSTFGRFDSILDFWKIFCFELFCLRRLILEFLFGTWNQYLTAGISFGPGIVYF